MLKVPLKFAVLVAIELFTKFLSANSLSFTSWLVFVGTSSPFMNPLSFSSWLVFVGSSSFVAYVVAIRSKSDFSAS